LLIKDESLTDLSDQLNEVLQANGVDPATAGVLSFLYGQARQATADDLVVFPSQAVIAQLNETAFATLQQLGLPAANAGQLAVNGITFPLEDQWILTPTEQDAVSTALAAYNQTIEALAMQYDVAFVDVNSYLSNVIAADGAPLADGSLVTDTYATGGGFSLDGVHPSPRGYALLANLFTDAINAKYGSNLPAVNPLDFTGLYIN